MAFSTAAEAIAAINASNLTDGQQIKQLLDDLVTFLSAAAGNVPAATTSTAGVVKQSADVAALTDSSGGTSGGDTIAAIPAPSEATTDTSAASLTSTTASVNALKNAVATEAAKVNAILTALKAAGIMA